MVVRLPFQPGLHGFHFRNAFRNHYTGGFPPVSTAGLCGGMVLAAFNYFRYGLPIPPHTDAEIDFNVNFELLRTLPVYPGHSHNRAPDAPCRRRLAVT